MTVIKILLESAFTIFTKKKHLIWKFLIHFSHVMFLISLHSPLLSHFELKDVQFSQKYEIRSGLG